MPSDAQLRPMKDWKTFWNEYPATVGESDFLRQVFHTVDGQPYTPEQFEAMVSSIRRGLRLGPTNTLLDVCCGNGLVTAELAVHCRQVLGVDFSMPLIDIARKFHKRENVRFLILNALELETTDLGVEAPFDRQIMYGALQHFQID